MAFKGATFRGGTLYHAALKNGYAVNIRGCAGASGGSVHAGRAWSFLGLLPVTWCGCRGRASPGAWINASWAGAAADCLRGAPGPFHSDALRVVLRDPSGVLL